MALSSSGDIALTEFSQLMTRTKRTIDAAARIGGEEFALVLPATDDHGAYLLAERLRRRQRDEALADRAELTVSFGIATYPRDGDDTDDLLRAADEALYLAKRLGRNRSVIYSPDAVASLPATAATPVEQVSAVVVLAETLDMRDSGTALHSRTVARLSEAVARELGLERDRVERIRLAGMLHDVGKIGVPDPILRKPGPLNEAEWGEMRKHPELGARILAAANLDDISRWVLCHHERPDGQGYPGGLSAGEIPLEARILAVTDAYEAMTSDRVYRKALPVEVAVEELNRGLGTQFDREVVEAFLRTREARAEPGAPTLVEQGPSTV